MIVTINNIYDNNMVEVSSLYGVFSGQYIGESVCINKKYDIEIDIPKTLSLNNFKISDNRSYSIITTCGVTTLTGFIEVIDDETLYFQLGSDILIVEVFKDVDYQSIHEKFVNLTIDHLNLYDTELPC